MECYYCKKIFKNQSSLNNHQKNARYCLKLRNEQVKFNCKYCDKDFSSKYAVVTHGIDCSESYMRIKEKIEKDIILDKDIQIQKLEDKITKLENKLENIALKAVSRSTYTQNNDHRTQLQIKIDNLPPLTDEHIAKISDYLTMDVFNKGIIYGYVPMIYDYILKDRVICTDYSRQKIVYKDENENIVVDPGMVKLVQKVCINLEPKNTPLAQVQIDKIIKNYGTDNYKENIVVNGMFNRFMGIRNGVQLAAKGEPSKFRSTLVGGLCKKV